MNIAAYLTAPVPRWAALLTIAVSTGSGVGATYLILKRKHEEEYDERLNVEVANTVKFITTQANKPATPMDVPVVYENPNIEVQKADKFRSVLSEMARVEELTEDYRSTDEPTEPVEPTLQEISHNIFTDAKENPEWDPEAEAKLREGEEIFIIEHDEYFESEYQTIQVTWYAGDGVLADEKEEHIPIPESVVGKRALNNFGHGSRDPNIVYVRNEKLGIDVEVVHNDGKYTEQVQGFMQHEDMYGGGNRRRVLRNHPFDDD